MPGTTSSVPHNTKTDSTEILALTNIADNPYILLASLKEAVHIIKLIYTST
jgi:hypothetical protein